MFSNVLGQKLGPRELYKDKHQGADAARWLVVISCAESIVIELIPLHALMLRRTTMQWCMFIRCRTSLRGFSAISCYVKQMTLL